MRQFLDTDGVRWRAFHQSFADWVRTAIPGAAVLGGEADATIGLALERLRRDDCLGGLGGYSVEHVVGHLVSALESLDGSHPSGPVVLEALAGVVGDDGWLVDAVTVRVRLRSRQMWVLRAGGWIPVNAARCFSTRSKTQRLIRVRNGGWSRRSVIGLSSGAKRAWSR